MHRKERLVSLLLMVCLIITNGLANELAVNPIFTKNMVLQRDMPIKIWGKGKPGNAVEVKLQEASVKTIVTDEGNWLITLPEQTTGGPYVLHVNSAEESLKLTNVMMGDVWLASGQSNIEWPMSKSDDGTKDLENGVENSMVRVFRCKRNAVKEPADAVVPTHSWAAANQTYLNNFSAVAWYFANHLQKETQVPIGIIQSARGGTRAYVWMSEEANKKASSYDAYQSLYERTLKKNPGNYSDNYKKWKAGEISERPKDPMHYFPGGYYNGQIAPLQPLAIKGVIWYQGETDRNRAEFYEEYQKTLIDDWRTGFDNPNLPFVYVQLPKLLKKGGDAELLEGNLYPAIREAQLKTLNISNTAMAVTIDTGDKFDIHPRIKKPVGERLAIAALGMVYGQGSTYMGPIVQTIVNTGTKFEVGFEQVGEGLKVKGDSLKGFQIAGENGKFHNAEAAIEGDKVIIGSSNVSSPKFIRYAWSGYPEANLYNSVDLPASPFRNDSINYDLKVSK